MAPRQTQSAPVRRQPKRSAGRPRPVYNPEAPKPRARLNTGIKKGKSAGTGVERSQKPKARTASRTAVSPPRSKNNTKKQSSYLRLGSVDSLLLDPSDDILARQDRWIPDLGQRPQVVSQPPASLLAPELWTAYCALDDYMYNQSLKDLRLGDEEDRYRRLQRGHRTQPNERPSNVGVTLWGVYRMFEPWVFRASLTAAEAVTHPTMDEVMDYQYEGGDIPPIAPQGWKWMNRELVPIASNGIVKSVVGGEESYE
ncbi:hypothetical protein SCAR479_00887 [Seiridium cardinale]|uniref:Uncharacterized protein n=1 Tax=Seiridium cardinale TaxID=138064 RepID=A0ABR2Y7R2_9PEZI